MKECITDTGIRAQSCSGPLVAVENRPQSCPTWRMRKLRYSPGATRNYLRTAPESIKHLAPLACPMLSKRKPPGREADA